MIRGLYTSAMGMIVQQKRQENVSHNLSNIETNSFKQQELIAEASFQMDVLNRSNNHGRLSSIGNMHFGVSVDDLYTDFEQGLLKETNNPLDFAIDGEGFFTVRLPNGQEAYTRDGSFRLNENGELVTSEGYQVLGYDGEPIQLGTENVTADNYGGIITQDGRYFSLGIVTFADAQLLHRLGDNLYTIEDGEPMTGGAYTLRQGFIESSNVNLLEEMVKMIEITRNFESNQKVVQAMDETLDKAVNEVGRL
ncbi:MAG TPA: flagellar basal-body rod protein FlgF [Clostridiales bacterium]|nr:flagellar basal-body rod protein FlgF [Clostridiales bacterium]